jgi:hypothetical protein
MSGNESNNHQNTEFHPRKGTLCKFGCSTRITFDNNILSKNGKMIPLNLDGSFHDCPARNQERSYTEKASSSASRFQFRNDKDREVSITETESKYFFNQILENIQLSHTQLERILMEQDHVKKQLEDTTQVLRILMEKVG